MGIASRSLCRTAGALREAFTRLRAYGPVLVEEFLPGDEYTVGIVGGEILGTMEVRPRQDVDDFISSLDVKRDYTTLVDYRLVSAPDVEDVALEVWRALGLRHVARVDIRRDREGVACFVEVNPLPGVHPVNSDLVILARLKGMSHEELIGKILRSAAFHAADPGPSWPSSGRKPPSQPAGSRRSVASRRSAVCFNDDPHLKSPPNPPHPPGDQELPQPPAELTPPPH